MANEFHGQRMSDYADIDSAQLTQEEKDYYKEHALVTTFGKTDGDASTGNSNYNVKLNEISKNVLPPIASDDKGKVLTVDDSGSLAWAAPGGGARYTPVTIADPTVSDGKITISPANNTMVTVTGLPNESFNFEIVAPQVAEGEYIDIVIQAQTASGDYAEHPIEASGFANVTMYEYGPKTMLSTVGSWTHIVLLGKCMLVYWGIDGY
jgi:hypothetical protein